MPARKNLDQLDTSQIYFVLRLTQARTQNRKIFDDMVQIAGLNQQTLVQRRLRFTHHVNAVEITHAVFAVRDKALLYPPKK